MLQERRRNRPAVLYGTLTSGRPYASCRSPWEMAREDLTLAFALIDPTGELSTNPLTWAGGLTKGAVTVGTKDGVL